MENFYTYICPCGDTLVGDIGKSLESRCESCGAVFKIEFRFELPELFYDGYYAMPLNDAESFYPVNDLSVFVFEHEDGSEQIFINLDINKARAYARSQGLKLTVTKFRSKAY